MEIVLGVVQILSLIAIVIYVIKTWQIANYNKKIATAQASSSVIAYFEFPRDGASLYLVFKNISIVPALNVNITIDPEISISRGKIKISELPVIRDGIPLIAPMQEIKFYIDEIRAFLGASNKGLPTNFNIKIMHKDGFDNQEHESNYKLDVNHFYYASRSMNNYEKIRKELEGIKTHLGEINNRQKMSELSDKLFTKNSPVRKKSK